MRFFLGEKRLHLYTSHSLAGPFACFELARTELKEYES